MLDNKNLNTLEFNKVLLLLSNEADSQTAKKNCLKLKAEISLDDANNALKQTNDAFVLISKFNPPSFSYLHDIRQHIARAKAGGVLSIKELRQISKSLACFKSLKKWKSQDDKTGTSLDAFFAKININKYLEDKINLCIISEEEVHDHASEELYSIRRKKQNFQDSIRQKLEKITRNPSLNKYLQEAIITIRDDRYVLPVKSECKANIPGIVHDSSSSGSTLFIEPISVVETNNNIRELLIKEKLEIEKILTQLSQDVACFSDDIYKNFEISVCLDVIFAKAKLAKKMKASVPILNSEGKIELHKARHPLIESEKVVPIDINLGNSFDVLVITGPNTGGKTVTLKTVGLFCIMAMCGLMIPAEEKSKLSIFDFILTDIGDEQSIEQSLSTFSSHMKNIVSIIETSNNNSLVLLDELGSGTDPIEGAALAMAVIKKLKSKNCKVIATTHYAELKLFAIKMHRVENACCEFDMKTLQPTYKLLIGIPGSSNAFEISRKLGLDKDIIKDAKSMLSSKNKKFEHIVRSMQQNIKELQIKQQKCDEIISQNVELRKNLQEEKNHTEYQLSERLNREKQKAKDIAQKAIQQSEALLDELNNLSKKKQKISIQKRTEIKQKIRNIQNEFDPVENVCNKKEHESSKQVLKKGDTVLVCDINTKATVLKLEQNSTALVKIGSLKTRTKISNLQLIKKSETENPSIRVNTLKNNNEVAPVTVKLDLRGKTTDEALLEIDKVIDTAILRNINTITIIHGKGSGKLKNSIHLYLSKQRSVKSYRLGNFGEGDSGVTIVTF